jgi:hypothetical protein
MTSTLTLADYAQLAPSNIERGVIDVFRRESFILDSLSFEASGGLQKTVIRSSGLPAVGFRKIGEGWSSSKAAFEPLTERVFDLGGDIDVDKLLVKADPSQMGKHTEAFVTAISYEFNDYFVNGDPTVDPDGFTGIWYRLVNYLAARQTVLGGGVDISSDAGAGLAANFDTVLDLLDELEHVVDGHAPSMFVLNEQLFLRLNSALRQNGLWSQDESSFGLKIARYGPSGPAIIDLGVMADQITQIIGNTELDDGSAMTGDDATSIYAIRTGDMYLNGLQLYPLDVNPIGLLQDGVTYRTVIDWPMGIMHENPRAIARAVGIVAN